MDHKPFTIEKLYGIGTYWWFEIFDTDFDHVGAESFIRETIVKFEADYSRFKTDSKLSKLNTKRHFENPSKEFCDLLQITIDLYHRSNHVFNAALGKTLSHRGYNTNYTFTSGNGDEQLAVATPELLTITSEHITLSGVGDLDFGGFGKGYLIDLLAAGLRERFGCKYFLINGGGDIYGTSQYEKPFQLYLEHPTKPGEYIHSIYINNKAFCSSSPFKRQWRDKATGEIKTHILNPKELDNLVEVTSFTVAETATMADAYATVASIVGRTPELCKNLLEPAGVSFVLVHDEQLIKSDEFPSFID